MSTKTKHTPGPWTILDYDGSDKLIRICGDTKWYGNKPFAFVDHDDCDHGEAEASAQLIAAAPDLLEACEDLLEQVDAYQRGWANGFEKPSIRIGVPDSMSAARNAIAKARGEQ